MKNKINELNKKIVSKSVLPCAEEQQIFIDSLVSKMKRDGEKVDQWIEKFKMEHGITDETF